MKSETRRKATKQISTEILLLYCWIYMVYVSHRRPEAVFLCVYTSTTAVTVIFFEAAENNLFSAALGLFLAVSSRQKKLAENNSLFSTIDSQVAENKLFSAPEF